MHKIPTQFGLNLMNLLIFELRMTRILAVYSITIACSHEVGTHESNDPSKFNFIISPYFTSD